jgi:transcriptional regulator with XRE-family HTH domain
MRYYVDPNHARELRVNAFMTQKRLAARAHVGLATIERLERGDEPVAVRYNTLAPVARVLGVKMEELMMRVEA